MTQFRPGIDPEVPATHCPCGKVMWECTPVDCDISNEACAAFMRDLSVEDLERLVRRAYE